MKIHVSETTSIDSLVPILISSPLVRFSTNIAMRTISVIVSRKPWKASISPKENAIAVGISITEAMNIMMNERKRNTEQ